MEGASPSSSASPAPDPQTEPERIGPYRILETLGEGGMGTVYRAERRHPVRMQVALKVIKLGMDSKEVMARFELERRALAAMQHDCIAKVLDAGTTDRGQPYFVMELAEGLPITDYCDKHRLSLKARIELFQRVCHGVQHAHQKGVVHRDLKPGNIMVVRSGDSATPKIIDFGLARATNRDLLAQSFHTVQDQIIGTPEYMAPEQASTDGEAVDTRADVYSLGVILYELLAGQLPFPSAELRRAGWLEIQRILAEEEPRKPSTKLSSHAKDSQLQASRLGMNRAALFRELRGDLDWIILKAMEKVPERRYDSPPAVAADLQRYLGHEPVLAGPPSAGYRVKKFLQRYRGRVLAVAVVVTTALVGAVAAWSYALDAEEKTTEALRQKEIAQLARERAVASEARAIVQENLAKKNAMEADRRRREAQELDSRLSAVVKLSAAISTATELFPAWPDKVPAMERWLKAQGTPLVAELPLVRQMLRELEQSALEQSAAERRADREGHPRHGEYTQLKKQVAALQLAMDVRRGQTMAPVGKLPKKTLSDPSALNSLAWRRVDPDRKDRTWGEEALGLAYAQRAMGLAKQDRHMFGDTLAWAYFATGQDDQAKAASQAALSAAPEAEKAKYRGYAAKLEQAIATAPAVLAKAKQSLAALSAELDQRRTWAFENPADGFLHETMQTVERGLVEFTAKTGALSAVRRGLAWAKRIWSLSKAHPKARATWEAARQAIAAADGVRASKLYAADRVGLKVQLGLVPIGMNPQTKLWEFYHLRSAYDPRSGVDPAELPIPRHEPDGSIKVTESTGIVFVLLPGGTFTMGAQKTDKSQPNYDEQAQGDETPHRETLPPFFLARHELTQGQWLRLSLQENPSDYPGNGQQSNFVGGKVTLAHPVESVDWGMSTELLARHGLVLPSESQWEYGCRGGTSTPWFPGDQASALEGYANTLDANAKEWATWTGAHVKFDDEHAIHAPVGSYKANAFGLHDVHGNVWEWCEDLYGTSRNRVFRGGSFGFEARDARSAYRNHSAPTVRDCDLGCRPSRARH